MPPNRFRLGVAQMTSTDVAETNLRCIENLFARAVADRADLVVFPENSMYFRIRSGEAVRGLVWNGTEMETLQSLVDAHETKLMITTAFRERDKLSNSTVLFSPRVSAEKLYSKIHLFDVDVEGAPSVRESDYFEGGRAPSIVEINGWKFGLSICYDLRFAELYLNYSQKVDVLLIPSAFLVPTGEAHWQVLLRARAIESQCFVAAPAQSGEHRSGDQVRRTYGHSLVVDPWGHVVNECLESPQVHVVELDRDLITKARAQIPMAGHRRL